MKPDEEFIEVLIHSDEPVGLVVNKLHEITDKVWALPHSIRPTRETRWEHVDDGDIEIVIKGRHYRMEVKYTYTFDFKSVADFPRENLIIDDSYKIKKKHTLPLLAYFLVNKSETGCFLIPVITKEHWFFTDIYDRREHGIHEVCMVNKKYVKYLSFAEKWGPKNGSN